MALTLRQFTGATVAMSIWQMNDRTIRLQKLTQAQYDEFAVARKGVGDAPGRPAPDAIFLMAAGGIPALNTVDGWPATEDAWEVSDPEIGRHLVVATGAMPDFTYAQIIAAPPINRRSQVSGVRVRSVGNRQIFRSGQYNRNRLDLITLTETPSLTREDVSGEIENHRSVTFDAASSSAFTSASSVTFAHTVAAESNVYIAVGGAGTAAGGATAVTYNGDDLTVRATVVNREHLTYWDRVAPDTGSSFNVVVTLGASNSGAFGAQSAYGVDQTTPRTDIQTNSGTSINPSVTVASAVGELVLSVIGFDESDTHTAVDSGFTQDWSLEGGGANARGSSGAHAPGATTSVSRTDTISGSDLRWTAIAASLKAASGSVETGAFSMSGAASVSSTGRSTARASVAATGVGAVSAVGRSTARASLAAAGVGAVAAVGRSIARASLAAAGVGDLSAAGIAKVRGVLASAGVASMEAEGQSVARAALASAGIGAVSMVGRSKAEAAFAAAGIGVFSGVAFGGSVSWPQIAAMVTGRVDENGYLIIKVETLSGLGPVCVWPHAPMTVTADGSLRVCKTAAAGTKGGAAPFANLLTFMDDLNPYLVVSAVAEDEAPGSVGPLTPMANLRGSLSSEGGVRVHIVGNLAGASGPLTPLAQLRCRMTTDDVLLCVRGT